jgi:hypothetical protein
MRRLEIKNRTTHPKSIFDLNISNEEMMMGKQGVKRLGKIFPRGAGVSVSKPISNEHERSWNHLCPTRGEGSQSSKIYL